MMFKTPHYYYFIPKSAFVEVLSFGLTGETIRGNVRLELTFKFETQIRSLNLNYFLLEDFIDNCVNLQYIQEHCPEELL